MTKEYPILDPCCGGRMFYFNKANPAVLFCDNRHYNDELCDGRKFEVNPDMTCDFTALPFPDCTFWHIVFDPPHLLKVGKTSWMAKKYGKLPKEWGSFLRDGFNECWRVLKLNGTLNFKWNENDIAVRDIVNAIGREPLYGQKTNPKTHWLTYVKLENTQ